MSEQPAPSLKLRWSGHTDKGKVRANNEDSFLCLQFDAREVHFLGKTGELSTAERDLVFAVSDGMGGAHAGEFASRVTIEKITRLLPRAYRQTAVGFDAGVSDVLGELFEQIHRALLFLGGSYDECSGMGATLTLCWFAPGWMYFGHIGDSRLYYLSARETSLRQISDDDTHVGWLFRNGKLNERQARTHPGRNSLQKALGAGHQFVDPQVGAIACEPGDHILLCTDGITDGLYQAQILDLLRAPTASEATLNPAHRLVHSATHHSGRDNATAIVVEVS